MDEAQAYFDVAVTAGKLTAEEAAEIVARQVEPTTQYVNQPITFGDKNDKGEK